MTQEMLIITSLFVLIVIILVLLFRKNSEYSAFKEKFKDVTDIRNEILISQNEVINIQSKIQQLNEEYSNLKTKLNNDYIEKQTIYEELLKEISIVEENLENISYGLYKPHYDYQSTQVYKEKLEEIRENLKSTIKEERATFCAIKWSVQGSEAKGRKMVKDASKLMLRAFNGECDAAIAKVNWGNISNMEARINKAFEAINKLGSTNEISITEEYLKLKLQELYLEFELEEQKYREKEEQRRIREQMREEEKALKEIEKIQKEAEADEERYQKALDKAKLEMEKAKEDEVEALQIKIKELQTNLEKAHEQKVRAISQAQLTKSGHVYIISNIGSFGEDVFKIGMTRRLEPLDRINELGDASVPFDFDVHGLIYSENAPELENKMHKKLESKRLNLVNYRAEFFKTSIDEIAGIVTELGLSIQLTKIAEAKEYRETASILKSKEKLIK
jgi:hypothetical protein